MAKVEGIPYIHPLFPKISAILNQLEGSIVVLCHQHADPDAIGSAIAVEELIKFYQPSTTVYIVAKSLNNLALQLIEIIDEKIFSQFPESFSHLVIVDTNNLDQTGFPKILSDFKGYRLSIDHHSFHSSLEAFSDIYIQDDSSLSCSELIFWLLHYLKVPISPKCANALLAGVIFDTQRFMRSSTETFDVVRYLCQYGAEYTKIISMVSNQSSFSERMARMKAFSRIKVSKFKEFIIAVTYVSSYEAASARGLISAGVDIALVFTPRKDETRVSLRASENIVNSLSIHLGNEFCPSLAKIINGTGGGHAGAAGINGKPIQDCEKTQTTFMNQILTILTDKCK